MEKEQTLLEACLEWTSWYHASHDWEKKKPYMERLAEAIGREVERQKEAEPTGEYLAAGAKLARDKGLVQKSPWCEAECDLEKVGTVTFGDDVLWQCVMCKRVEIGRL